MIRRLIDLPFSSYKCFKSGIIGISRIKFLKFSGTERVTKTKHTQVKHPHQHKLNFKTVIGLKPIAKRVQLEIK